MLDKCANPGCLKVFHSLREGRLFVRVCDCAYVPRGREMSLYPDCHNPLEYFWLCGHCAHTLTVVFDPSGKAVVRSRRVLLPGGPPRPLLQDVA
jgi:hypothetical protein